ncbi:hypothetical protein AQJ66_22935 [Streptomyces bungoensis]|uniref:Uncharacterized protein n=1 Tax=Streptomyces bungoensis TaxID=285568 RepID=A0A101SXI4_9ACTN|nr:hypothetical protein [Streptomyces bungoensis]KUN81922.1 hypothetical protein AQJ66_22935 [Streptomyces bungoensis]
MTREAADGAAVRARLAQARSRTAAALVLGGPDLGTPPAERPAVGEVFDPDGPAELRALTSTGTFTGGLRRCPGSPTVALLDADGAFVASGSPHGGRDISWERGRFRNNLTVADPGGPLALLDRYPGQRR